MGQLSDLLSQLKSTYSIGHHNVREDYIHAVVLLQQVERRFGSFDDLHSEAAFFKKGGSYLSDIEIILDHENGPNLMGGIRKRFCGVPRLDLEIAGSREIKSKDCSYSRLAHDIHGSAG